MSAATMTSDALLGRILDAPRVPRARKSWRFSSLLLAVRQVTRDGPWMEFGVHEGRTARLLLESGRLHEDGELHLFDSFEGLPADWEDRRPAGYFALTETQRPRFSDPRVRTHVGLFSETVPLWLEDHPTSEPAFVHIDCDLYESTRDVLFGLNDRIRPGCVVAFDELYNYEGFERHEYRALAEWLEEEGREVTVLARSRKRQAVVRVDR